MNTSLSNPKLATLVGASLLALAAYAARPVAPTAAAARTAPQQQAGRADKTGETGETGLTAETAESGRHPVDPLDRVVRARFHNHIGFGMARIATERKFVPETAEEREAVRAMKRAGYEVGLFLVGRGVYKDAPPENRRADNLFGGVSAGRAMSGPIFVSGTDVKKLPDVAALWDETRRAMTSFAGGTERYGFEAEGWRVEARPIRAADSCLRCHNSRLSLKLIGPNGAPSAETAPRPEALKVGDPLGAMLYAYRDAR